LCEWHELVGAGFGDERRRERCHAFVALADRYATAGQVRAAHRLVVIAAELDPEGSAAKLAATRQAVEEWKKTNGR